MEDEFKELIQKIIAKIRNSDYSKDEQNIHISEAIVDKINHILYKMESDVLNIDEECLNNDSSLDLCHFRNFGGEGNKCKWCIDLQKLFYEQE